MYKNYQKTFNMQAIDNTLMFFEQEVLPEEKKEQISQKFFVVSTETNTIEMKVIVKQNKDFIMQIREDLEEYKINKIKVTIKMELLKKHPYIHPEYKEELKQKCGKNTSSKSDDIEQEYLKYALKSANIFQMSRLDKDYLQYFISHEETQLDNNTLSFIYMVLDKFLDALTNLPNRELLHKTVSNKQEVIFNLKNNNVEIKKVSKGYLMFMDLNNLKAMNDIYGHTIADILLISFAKVLKNDFKEIAHFRLGGDEFVSTTTDKEAIYKLSDYLHSLEFNNKLKEMIFEETDVKVDEQLLFFASNGVHPINLSQQTLVETLDKAEQKMYVNKSFLHLEYGVYDRRSEGEGEMSTKLAGKINKDILNKIKTSSKFKNFSNEEQYSFLTHIKKNAWELYNSQHELENLPDDNKEHILNKISKYEKALNRLLESI